MSGEDVSALQTVLKGKGFFNTDITGYFGQITLQAVADFQRSVGLDHLGYVGPATRAILNGEAIPSSAGTSVSNPSLLSSLVSQLQQLLRNAGYYMVSLTGTLDQATLAAAQSISSGTNTAPVRSGGKPQHDSDEEEIVADTIAPALSAISSSPSQTTATISWFSDEPSDSRIDFGTTSSYGTASSSGALSTSHTILLSGLSASTTYHFRIQSADAASNTATSSDQTFTTTATPDTTAPVLSDIASSTSTTTATISWTTDEPSDSRIDFGTTTAYGTASTSATLSTGHTIVLTGLTASTTYHFRVQSVDAAGNVATSSDIVFVTTSNALDPSSVEGLLRWYSASAITGVSDGDAVASWPDRSVANDTGTQTTMGNRPAYKLSGLNGHPTTVFNGSSFVSFTPVSTIQTAIFVVKATRPYPAFAPILGHASAYDYAGPVAESPRLLDSNTISVPLLEKELLKVNGISVGSSTLAMKPSSFAIISITTPGTTTSAQYITNDRNATGRRWRGEYADILLFDRVLDPTTLSRVESYLSEYYAIPLNSLPSYDFKASLVFNGDSMTTGVGATGGQNYPTQLVNTLPSGVNYWPFTNLGSSGRTAATLDSVYVSQTVPRYNASVPKNIELIWIGTNDLFYGTSATDTYNILKSIWAQSRERGFKVVAFTVLSRSNAGTPAGFNTARAELNALIRSDASLYDGLVDVAADSRIGYDGAETDTTYFYTDLVHMNNTGYGVIASLTQSVVSALVP